MSKDDVDRARSRFARMYARGAFKPVDRFISDRPNAEDRLQDAICQTYEMDLKAAEKGRLLDPALLVHATKLRAIEVGRRFVKTDAQPKRDVLDPRNFSEGKIEVHRFDGLLDLDTGELHGEGDRALELGLVEELSTNPTAGILSAIDLLDWLRQLSDDDRELLALRLAGFTYEEIGEAVGRPMKGVVDRVKALGSELAARTGKANTGAMSRRPSAARQQHLDS